MPQQVRKQEIDAQFVQLAGAMFKREDVKILEYEPDGVRWVRAWDLAYTTRTTSDYTAGVRGGMMTDGTIVIADVAAWALGMAAGSEGDCDHGAFGWQRGPAGY